MDFSTVHYLHLSETVELRRNGGAGRSRAGRNGHPGLGFLTGLANLQAVCNRAYRCASASLLDVHVGRSWVAGAILVDAGSHIRREVHPTGTERRILLTSARNN